MQTSLKFNSINKDNYQNDDYSIGGAVSILEKTFADILGKESAMFFPTGTLANHLALRKLCGTNQNAIVQHQSHIYLDTGDSLPRLSGIKLTPLGKDKSHFKLEELKDYLYELENARVYNPVGAVSIESPVRRKSGKIIPYEDIKSITEYCKSKSIPIHLDGARLFIMSEITGIDVKNYSQMFNTVYISLYKYFGAPFGAILAAEENLIRGLHHDRRMFGGSIYSANIAAIAALNGIKEFQEKFKLAITNAKKLLIKLNTIPGLNIETIENGSNVHFVKLDTNINLQAFIQNLKNKFILVSNDEIDVTKIRLNINVTILNQSIARIFESFKESIDKPR